MKGPALALGAMMFAGAATAAPSPLAATLTLAQAQDIALRNHPLIHSAASALDAAEAAIRIARAPLYPQIALTATQTIANNGSRIASVDGLTDPTVIERGSAGIVASQLVSDFGKTASEEAASRSEAEAARSQARLTQAQIILNVTQAYYAALDTAGLAEVARETLSQRRILLDQVAALARSKLKSSLDVSIAGGDLDEARQFLNDATAQHENALAALSEALGDPDFHAYAPLPPASVPRVSGDLDQYIDAAVASNPALRERAAQEEAARSRAEAAQRAFYPEIRALAYAGGTPETGAGAKLPSTYAVGGVVLRVPLYSGGALSAAVRRADAEADAEGYRLEEQRNRLRRDVHAAFDDLRSSYDNIAVTRSILDNAERALRLTRASYQIGASSIVDLSAAQLRRTQAAIANTDATYHYLLRRAAFDYLLGATSPTP